MPEHVNAPLGERHPIHNWEYADATARLAATGFIPADVTKWAKQIDDGTFWELTDDSPITWTQRTGAGSIPDNSVTNAKLADMATQTIKGRTTAGTGDPEDLSATQATAVLNNVVGDSGVGGTKGLVPAPAAGDAAAGKFLKASGAWASPATGASINPTDNQLPRRSNSTTFADSFLRHDSVNSQTFSDAHICLNHNTGKTVGFGSTGAIAFGAIKGGGQGTLKVVADAAGNPGSILSEFTAPALPGGNPTPWSSVGMNFERVLTSSGQTIGNPGHHGGDGVAISGYRFILFLIQDATGGRTVIWGTDYRFPGGTLPTLTVTGNAVDVFEFICRNDIAYCIGQWMNQA